MALVYGQLDMTGNTINGVLTFFQKHIKAKSFIITVPEMMQFHAVLTSRDWLIKSRFSTIRVVQY